MPAVTGADYLYRLKNNQGEVWLEGTRVRDVTTHPATRNGAQSV
ncbi:MAG: 4-hydroxyphenylacetate 3-hydroxylase N-terminal domain-containing protein, partial [Chloroflexota bacterium]